MPSKKVSNQVESSESTSKSVENAPVVKATSKKVKTTKTTTKAATKATTKATTNAKATKVNKTTSKKDSKKEETEEVPEEVKVNTPELELKEESPVPELKEETKSKTRAKTKKNLALDTVEETEPESLPKESESLLPEEIVEIKPKSTRGRKAKPKPELPEGHEEPPKQKRGRKPKPKPENPEPAPETSTKRKGKNPIESYGLVQDEEEDDPFFQNMTEEVKECQETPILKLNITAKDIQKIKDPNTNLMEGDSELNIPHAFITTTDTFSYFQGSNTPANISNVIKEDQKMTEKEIEEFRISREKELEESSGDLETSKLLCQFLEHNRKGTWPSKSNYDCMWCRYPFESVPWPIPIRLKDNDKFDVFGNFCSPGCAAAFIFAEYHDDEMWDRYALLNMLYQKVYQTYGTVKSAPSTLLLKKLGGILTIEEFREISHNPNHDYFVKMPPMVSIIPSVEEIQQTSLFNDRGSHNQLNKELMMKASNELRLKRSKPIYDKNNTLDNYFHISSSELQG